MHRLRNCLPTFSLLLALILAFSPPAMADEDTAADHLLKAEVALQGDDFLTA
ncbi:MAG: hypothetical protein GQ577_00585, partial [Woeseiaceae bacterium]|nr:hypothetical protein [Woeseiaceae bacterium]